MLYDCVNSFFEHCNHDLFSIFIADTGSTEEEKDWIRKNILTLGDIKLIEYNYFHMAISLAELQELINFMFDQVDQDKSGFLEKPECLTVAKNLHESMKEKNPDSKEWN